MALAHVSGRGRIFHGWYIVIVAFVANATSGMGGYSFGLFFNPMGQALGWSRTAISWGLTLRAMLNIATGPIYGPIVDKKHGAMLLMIGGGVMMGAGLILTSQVSHLWQFYLFFGLLYGGAASAVGAQIVTPTIISKWFIRMRGRAIAFSVMGTSAGGIVFIPLTAFVILNFGWREAWVVLGIVALLLIAPLSALFVRRSPEDLGLLPDGAAQPHGLDLSEPERWTRLATHHDWTLKEASRTPALWLIVTSFSISSAGLGGLVVHAIPYMTDKGYSPAIATAMLTTFSIIVMAVKPLWGLLGERIQVRYLMTACFAISGIGMLLFVLVKSGPLIIIFPIAYGIGAGGFLPLMNLVWANYFGRAFLGTIRGVFHPPTHIAGAFSPVFAAYIFDVTGSYDLAFIIFSVCLALGAVAIFLARRPEVTRQKLDSPAPLV